jgi:hypothetical protein
MLDRPGIFLDVSVDEYHQDPCVGPSLTQSLCKILLERSPAHAKLEHPRLADHLDDDEEEPEKYDKTKAIGDAAHGILIGRGKSVAIGNFNNWMSKDAKQFKKDGIAAGKLVILDKHFERANAMVRAFRAQADAAGYHDAFNNGNGEVVIIANEGGIWLRALVDWMVSPRLLFDLKTSALCCAPHIVEDRPSVMGWDIQGAMQERIFDAVDPAGAGRRKFVFFAQENTPPYALTPVELSEADLTMGRKKLAMAFSVWSACMKAGHWPMYPAETVVSRPRGFLETKFLEREIAHHERKAREPMPDDLIMGG